MPKTKTTFKEKIANSLTKIKTILPKSKPLIKPEKKISPKPKKPLLTIANINKVRKIVSNPIVQQIGLKLIDLASPRSFSIYTHNICWTQPKANHIKIAAKLQTLQPDIVCLQEVVFQTQSETFNLPQYHKSIAQDSGKRIVKGGLAIYSKVKPICVDFIKFEKQGKILSPQLAERQLEKGFLVAEFQDYLIINTHFTSPHRKSTVDTLKVYHSQIQQILDLTKTSTKQIFLVGDLCFSESSENFKNYINPNFIDLTINIPYTFLKWKTKSDYILSCKAVKSYKTKIIRFAKGEPSDHLAVYSKIVY